MISQRFPQIEYRHLDADPSEFENPKEVKKFGSESAYKIYTYVTYICTDDLPGGVLYSRRDRPTKAQCIKRVTSHLIDAGYDIEGNYVNWRWSDGQLKGLLQFFKDNPPRECMPQCRLCDDRTMPVIESRGDFPICPNCEVPWERPQSDPFETTHETDPEY